MDAPKVYTRDIKDVVEVEKNYIDRRRKITDTQNRPLTGLCISGGGIRAATLGLGMIQALTKKNIFKTIDYLSTVSGGGYIGSCLTTLFSHRTIPEDAKGAVIGVTPETSPFVGLNETTGYAKQEKTVMSVRHQMHHLRSRGNYLVPIKRLLSRDVQRAVGTVAVGVAHHWTLLFFFLVFAAGLIHGLCYSVMGNSFAQILGYCREIELDEELTGISYVTAYLVEWFSAVIGQTYIEMIKAAIWDESDQHVIMIICGILWTAVWGISVLFMRTVITMAVRFGSVSDRVRAGMTVQDHIERYFVLMFNVLSVVTATIFSLFLAWTYPADHDGARLVSFFFLPAGFGLGGWLAAVMLLPVIEFFDGRDGSIRRSLFSAMRGACIYGFLFSLAVPLVVVVAFAIANVDRLFWTTLISLAVTFVVTRMKTPAKKDKKSAVLAGVRIPLLNLAVGVFVLVLFSWISALLMKSFYPLWLDGYDACKIGPWETQNSLLLTLMGGFGLTDATAVLYGEVCTVGAFVVVFLGLFINSNRVSPHYFYRDRLADAYLRTSARVERDAGCKAQGLPLAELRNDEEMPLTAIGGDNGCGPYHLFVTAINLQGSDELNRKTMLSDHFVFSKDYVGSEVTGYVRTDCYRQGRTRIARAMTISAAAAGSAMGKDWFFAQSFAMTLFNIRLGYWMANPWLYCNMDEQKAKAFNPERLPIFWPKYLSLETMGHSTARHRLVNLSDGGHTGDNLGLVPLLRRRCEVIYVGDFEHDPEFTFGSFNHAVRMAFIEENIVIDIDLRPLIGEKIGDDGSVRGFSRVSVVEGTIRYPATETEPASTGKLIYMKSSLSETEERKLPPHVLNYKAEHPEFPHQTTADQFFDDAQFEAYRALGEVIAMGVSA